MLVSEARLAANRANAQKSRGPTTAEGKEISRRNGLKHGLAGEGVVVPEGEQEEVDRRVEAFAADMKPRSPAGLALIVQMATLSVRAERAARQESAAIAMHVRHAADAFDEERIGRVDALMAGLADDPRAVLRKLRKMPEGVERLVDAWHDLRADLAIEPEPDWTGSHLERAANLAGFKARHARGSRIGVLSRAVGGDLAALADSDGAGLASEPRRAWALAALLGLIDGEIAALEAHYVTLDFETIEVDRAEAGARALFDPSKPAALARRYESESRRGFSKALKEYREVEAESAARAEPIPSQAPSPAPSTTARPVARMGSSREIVPEPARHANPGPSAAPTADFRAVRGLDGTPSRPASPARVPG